MKNFNLTKYSKPLILLVFIVVLTILRPSTFLTVSNFANVLWSISVIGIMVCGTIFVFLIGLDNVILTPHVSAQTTDALWSMYKKAIDIAADFLSGKDIGRDLLNKGLYLWSDDDRPLRNGIISTDNRAYAYPLRWREDGTEEKAFQYSAQHIMACQPVALLAWLRDNEPESYEHIKYVFECKDYIRFRLTGVPGAELTDISGSGLLNLHTAEYSPELLELFGLSEVRYALPPLCRATDICGKVTLKAAMECGLRPGTPVIGGMFDINACAIASGVIDEDKVCMIAGTWSINECVRRVREAGYEITIEPTNMTLPHEEGGMDIRMAFCKGPVGEDVEFFTEL